MSMRHILMVNSLFRITLLLLVFILDPSNVKETIYYLIFLVWCLSFLFDIYHRE